MARVVLGVKKLNDRNVFADAFTALTTAVDATDGAEFVMDRRDDKYVVLVKNASSSAAKTVTVKAGIGIQGVMDLTCSVAKGSYTFVALDSGRFKNVTGADKGKVVLKGESAEIEVAVLCLP